MTETMPSAGGGFVPTEADVAAVLAWFEEWDALAAEVRVDEMADRSMFPVNVVSTRADGTGVAQSWDREEFRTRMGEVVGGASGVELESTRTPHFLSEDLCFVVTDVRIRSDGATQHSRYGDLLVRSGGRWIFQTMVQGGWGDYM